MRIALFLAVIVVTALPQVDVPRGGAPVSSPPPRMSAVVQTCVPCHGVNGEGKAGAGFPRIAGQSAYYLLKQLNDYADGRRSDPTMEPIARGLTHDLRATVAEHFARIEAPAAAHASPFTASWTERGGILAAYGDLARGVQACVNCHGPGGTGQPPNVPYLAGLDDGYIRATLEAWRDGRRKNDAGQQMIVIAKALSLEDIASVARYFAGVAPPPPAPPDVLRPGQPQLLPPGMSASVMVDSTAEGKPGVEGRAPLAGGNAALGQSGRTSASPGRGGAGAAGRDSSRSGSAGSQTARSNDSGNAARGSALVASGEYGCTACHAVPGIRTPRGIVGPRLGGIANRPFIAGQLPNTRDVLVAFLRDPPALVPATGMPNVGLSVDDARHIAAFLYSLPAETQR